MLERVTRVVIRRRVQVLIIAPVLLVLAGLVGAGVPERLGTGGWQLPTDPSTRASATLDRDFEFGPADLILLVDAAQGVDQPAAVAAGSRLSQQLAAERGVGAVTSYWLLGRPPALRSADRRHAVLAVRLLGDEDQRKERADHLARTYGGTRPPLTVRVGGHLAAQREMAEWIERDLRRSEVAATPVVALILLLVFGGVVAALLPLAIGLIAVVGTLAALALLVTFTDVSLFSLNVTTALGFGLAVDYGLFIFSRFRDEREAGAATEDAVVTTVLTAGRTVLFSALTVVISLSSLLLFPLYFLRSFAYGGMTVVALAALAALVVLPALLAVLGPRVEALPLRRRRRPRRGPASGPPVGAGANGRAGRVRRGRGRGAVWHRLATVVMRRPLAILLIVVPELVVLGLPFARASFALPDDRLLPASSETHQVAQQLRSDFPQLASDALFVVAPHVPDLTAHLGDVAGYAAQLSRLDDVVRVDALTGSYVAGMTVRTPERTDPRFVSRDGQGTWLSLVTAVESYSDRGERLAREVKALRPPFTVLVGGNAAHLIDTKRTIGRTLPVALAVVIAATMLVLFLFTGSVVLPVKAVLLNLLSLTATFGMLVWGFQEGHLRPIVGEFQVTNTLELTTPILMFCIAFGLSMDYEVFLLSRVKEEYDLTGDNERSVALGLQRTGPLITSAAIVVIVVLLAMATSRVTMLKLLGVGLAFTVALDVTLVRGVLVPALMRLAGRMNWWAPGSLRRLHARVGLRESPFPPGNRLDTDGDGFDTVPLRTH